VRWLEGRIAWPPGVASVLMAPAHVFLLQPVRGDPGRSDAIVRGAAKVAGKVFRLP